MSPVTVRGFGRMLVEAGVMTEDELNKTARIVIDADTSNGSVLIYKQEFGNAEALAKLAPMLKGMISDA